MTIVAPALVRARPRLLAAAVPTTAVGLAAWLIATSVLLARDPASALAAAITPVVVLLLAKAPLLRVVAVIGGGLLVLGSSSDVGWTKIAYAALLVLCTTCSAVSLLRARPGWARPFRALLIPGFLFATTVLIGLVASPTQFQATDAVRGGIFWLMILAAPVLGLDAARTTSPAVARALIAGFGLLSALGFATEWLAKRGASSLELDRLAAGSFVLPALAFSLAFVHASRGRIRHRWLIWAPLATVILIALLITGTRTNLIVLLAVFGTLGPARLARVTLRRALVTVGMIAATAALLTPLAISALISNPEFIASRMLALTNTASGGLSTDASFVMRQSQTVAAQTIVDTYPLFGYGVGWVVPSDQIFDTPWISVVRVGWVGIAALVIFLGASVVAMKRSTPRPTSAHAVVTGAGFSFAALLLLLSPIEDRCFGFALTLIFLLVATEARQQYTRSSPLRA